MNSVISCLFPAGSTLSVAYVVKKYNAEMYLLLNTAV